MGLFDLLMPGRRDRFVENLAGQVANQVHFAVQNRLGAQVATMDRAEARGYVRARAALVIRREVERTLALQPRLPRAAKGDLIQRATNQVVQRVTHDLFYVLPTQVFRKAA